MTEFLLSDLKSGTLQGSGGFAIFYFIVFMVMGVLLMLGARHNIRALIMPWIYGMYVIILFQTMFGLWLIFGYYIYLELVFAALCNWAWMAFNIYCALVVKSHLRNLRSEQSPDIAYLNDI